MFCRLLFLFILFFSHSVFCQTTKTSSKRDVPIEDLTIINSSVVNHYNHQKKYIHSSFESQGIVTTKDNVPFWMRANRYGSIPLAGPSLSFLASASKSYDTTKNFFNYGFSFEGRLNTGQKTNFNLIEGYGKIRLSIFELKAGRSKEFDGLVDSTLSGGAFALSGNALGIPKIQLAIPEYFTLPFTYKLLAIKGSFSHGWLGENEVFDGKKSFKTYYHQKTFYAKLGRPNWRLNLFWGFNHHVFWGSEKEIYGSKWTLSPTDAYLNVVFGKTTRLSKVSKSKIGNALGSIDIGAKYEFNRFKLSLYHQFFYDVGALYYLANVKDGLTGVSVTNKRQGNKSFHWNKFLLEYFYTIDQAGYPWSKRTPSGDEDYYNNYFYTKGWSYQDIGLGSPLITEERFARKEFPNDRKDYFINNRVIAIQSGIDFDYKKINFIVKLTGSKNYGTFATSPYGTSLGKKFRRPIGKFNEANQFSFYLEGKRVLKRGLFVGGVFAFDYGDLLNNSTGIIIKAGIAF